MAKKKPDPAPDPLHPPPAILVALGSIAVHAEELLSPTGHAFDRDAMETAFNMPGVREWLAAMNKAGLMPAKR